MLDNEKLIDEIKNTKLYIDIIGESREKEFMIGWLDSLRDLYYKTNLGIGVQDNVVADIIKQLRENLNSDSEISTIRKKGMVSAYEYIYEGDEV